MYGYSVKTSTSCSSWRGELSRLSKQAAFGIVLMSAIDTGCAASGDIENITVAGNAVSSMPSVSAGGRYVAFESLASNLVAGDTNGKTDIFMYDRVNKTTQRVSVGVDGEQSNNSSYFPVISGNGRYVAFDSLASNLVSGDTNARHDLFLYDRVSQTTRRLSANMTQEVYIPSISDDGCYVAFGHTGTVFVYNCVERRIGSVVNMNGEAPNGYSDFPTISADGSYVAFESNASDLVGEDTGASDTYDAFVYDRVNKTTERVSVGMNGAKSDNSSSFPVISADGRYVTFESLASNLVMGDTNGKTDVFVYDRVNKTTERVSVDVNGVQGNDNSNYPTISVDGCYVAFESLASNLVVNDLNQTHDLFVKDRGCDSSQYFSQRPTKE